MSYSIKDKQIGKSNSLFYFLSVLNSCFFFAKEVLKRMLNFDQNPLANSNLNEPSWKVLVYDDLGQDIISPLLTVKELRDLGVTAHLYVYIR